MVVLQFGWAIQTLQQYLLEDNRLEISLEENGWKITNLTGSSDVSCSKVNNIWNCTTEVLSAG